MTTGVFAAAGWLMALGAGPATLPTEQAARFAQKVAAYHEYVTPRCAPQMVGAYIGYSQKRDSAFVRSLQGTPLRAAYFEAIRTNGRRDAGTVFHCDGPPPPPPPGAAVTGRDPRTIAITRSQERLQSQARDLPAYFDGGDAAFMQMQAARDAILAGTE